MVGPCRGVVELCRGGGGGRNHVGASILGGGGRGAR